MQMHRNNTSKQLCPSSKLPRWCMHKRATHHLAALPDEVKTIITEAFTLIAART